VWLDLSWGFALHIHEKSKVGIFSRITFVASTLPTFYVLPLANPPEIA
jgi:hypothetical protein